MAKMAADQLKLDSVRWIPVGNPAHKEIVISEASLKNVTNCSKNLKDDRMVIDQRELSNSILSPPLPAKL